MTRDQNPRPGQSRPFRLLLVSFFALSLFSYLTFDLEHPPTHTCGGATQCECPGDDAPDPNSMPEIHVPASQEVAFVDLCFLDRPKLSSSVTATRLREAPELVPRLLLQALPPPVLLI